MCCEQQSKKHSHGGSCGCRGSHQIGPCFWSKKRKIKMLEKTLENLTEEAKDLEELIAELKKEK